MSTNSIIKKIFQRKSEIVMFLAGACIIASVITVALTDSFVFWKFAKFFYFTGVILILFDQ